MYFECQLAPLFHALCSGCSFGVEMAKPQGQGCSAAGP